MMQIAHVRIADCCWTEGYLAEDLALIKGDQCIVQTNRGTEMGTVVFLSGQETAPENTAKIPRVIRKANAKDLALYQKKRSREDTARKISQDLIRKHKLVMKLTRVEYLWDGSKVIFYYTADGRVDFRSLVKDLASSLKTRIEMRQIGVRDEAKLLGGVGCCGLPLCCHIWIQKFYPVSIKIAKRQCLNLNPSRLSGVCGRLMCCLMYEKDAPSEPPAPGDGHDEQDEELWTDEPAGPKSF